MLLSTTVGHLPRAFPFIRSANPRESFQTLFLHERGKSRLVAPATILLEKQPCERTRLFGRQADLAGWIDFLSSYQGFF